MGEVEKRTDLDPDRAALLAAMGVQIWYARPPLDTGHAVAGVGRQAPPARRPAEPETPEIEVGPVAEPIAFSWVKSGTGMVVTSLGLDRATVGLLKDILVFGDWARGNEITQPQQGDFRWPQLLDSGGTPERALAVFVDKHLTSKNAWLALSADVAPSLAPWLANIDLEVLEVPDVRNNIGDAAIKKSIWQSLKLGG